MIAMYLLFVVIAIATYAFIPGLGALARVVLSLLVFLIPAIAMTAYVIVIGDRASPNSVVVRAAEDD